MKSFLILFTAISLIGSSLAMAQTFKQVQGVIANGAGTATGSFFTTKVTVGQWAIGTSTSTGFTTEQGFEFLSGSDKTYDLTFENLSISPTTAGPGTTISITFDVKNLGDGTIPGASYGIEVYLSTDQVIDTGEDLEIISIPDDIDGGGTYFFPTVGDDNQIDIPVSTSPGSYFIIIRADNGDVISESDETNNEASTALTITSDGTAPVLANFTPVTHFTSGSTVSVSITDNVDVGVVNFYHRGITTPVAQGWGYS